jgi:hypothetical protein
MKVRGTDWSEMIALSPLCAGYSAILYMIRRPTESDFEVRTSETGVEVFFRPTVSYYTFNRFAHRKDIADFGPLSPDPRVRHAGPSGGTGNYPAPDVLTMAFRLASQAARQG